MKLTLTWLTARCAAVSIEDGGFYHTLEPYTIELNGKHYGETDRVVTPVFGLMPETAYTLCAKDQAGNADELTFTTPYEFVTLNVRAFGAVGDGETNDTAAIQAAIMACPAESRVLIPKGTYRVSHLFLTSGLRLEIAQGAVIQGIPSREGLPVLPGMIESTNEQSEYPLGTWEGNPLPMFASLLTGIQAKNVEVYGEGVLDGMASKENWWKDRHKLQIAWRPRMIFLHHCEKVTIMGLTIQNSPAWNVHPFFSKRIHLLGLSVCSPADSPNTDGIDPESCSRVEIKGVRFSVGDDCIALKAGKRYMGDTYATPCENVRVSHCEMGDGHGAVTIGSEMSGGVRDVLVEDCDFHDTDRGLRVKTRRGRGRNAVVDQIVFRRIHMKHVKTPFTVNCFYYCDPDGHAQHVQDRGMRPVEDATPAVKSLTFEQITCEDCHAAAAYFLGLPERLIGSIRMKDVSVSFTESPTAELPIMADGVEPCIRKGIIAENVDFFLAENVNVNGADGDGMSLRNVTTYKMEDA